MKTIIEMAKECELLAGNAEHGIYAMALTRFADLVTDQANERANTSWALMCEKMVEADRKSQERNFCPRCGKRTADLTVVHTCTPPASQITDSVTGPKLLTDDAIEEIARKILSQGYKHRDMERRFARAIEQAYGIGGAQ